MKKVLLLSIICALCSNVFAQTTFTGAFGFKKDAQDLELSVPDTADHVSAYYVLRTYGSNEQRFYQWFLGVPGGGSNGMNPDSLNYNISNKYIIIPSVSQYSKYVGYWSTPRLKNTVANIPDFYTKLQTYLAAQGLSNSSAKMDSVRVLSLLSKKISTETDPLFDSKFSGKSTSNLSEGSNLYFTNTRVQTFSDSRYQPLLGYTAYNNSNPAGYISGFTELDPLFNTKFATKNTSNLAEGSNLYFTTARAQGAISAGSGLGYSLGIMSNLSPDQIVSLTSGSGISVSGVYPNFTVSQSPLTVNIAPGRTLNSSYTVSTTKPAFVFYSISTSVTNPLLVGSSTAFAYLEYSINAGSTWITASQVSNTSTVGLSVTIQITNAQTNVLCAYIPANALVRLRSTTSGTAAVSILGQNETY